MLNRFSIITVVLLLAAILFQWYKINSLKQDIIVVQTNSIKLNEAINTQKATINNIQKSYEKNIELSKNLYSQLTDIVQHNTVLNEQLNDYRSTLKNAVLQNPKAKQSDFNKSLASLLLKFSKATKSSSKPN